MKIPSPALAKAYFEDKISFTTDPVGLDAAIQRGDETINIVDVRAAEDYAKAHIPGAINLPKDKWSTLLGLKKDKVNIVYCYSQTCHLAAKAAVEFSGKGFPVMEMEGGFRSWQEHQLPAETLRAAPERRHARAGMTHH